MNEKKFISDLRRYNLVYKNFVIQNIIGLERAIHTRRINFCNNIAELERCDTKDAALQNLKNYLDLERGLIEEYIRKQVKLKHFSDQNKSNAYFKIKDAMNRARLEFLDYKRENFPQLELVGDHIIVE